MPHGNSSPLTFYTPIVTRSAYWLMTKAKKKNSAPPSLRALPYELETLSWLDAERTANAQGIYCYCGKTKAQNEPMLRCQTCRQLFHSDCVNCLPNPQIFGDTFYTFQCSVCGKGKQLYERANMSWIAITQLAIYNLLKVHPEKEYVRWKEDICKYIEDHWEYLKPGKSKSPTWQNTVASVLSTAQGKVFKSGTEKYGQAGYWTLQKMEPPSNAPGKPSPVKPRKNKETPKSQRQSSAARVDAKTETSKASSSRKSKAAVSKASASRTKVQSSSVDDKQTSSSSRKRKAEAAASSPAAVKKLKQELKVEELSTSNDLEPSSFIKRVTSKSLPASPNPSPLSTPSASPRVGGKDIKALAHAAAEISDDDIFGDSESELSEVGELDTDEGETQDHARKAPGGGKRPESRKAPKNSPESSGTRVPVGGKAAEEVVQVKTEDIEQTVENGADEIESKEDSSDAEVEGDQAEAESEVAEEEEENEEDHEEDEEEEDFKEEAETKVVPRRPPRPKPRPQPPPFHQFLTPEQEHALLQRLSSHPKLPPAAARLRCKIHLRRLKRNIGLPILDLDSIVSRSLREGKHPTPVPPPILPRVVRLTDGRVVPLRVPGLDARRALERFKAVRNVTHTPAIHSFATRLYGDGFKADTLTHSTSRISSYTGRPLRPYIWRDYAARPAMKAVLEDVVRRAHRDEPAWEPQPSYPVDYVYLDQMHIPQVNELLRHTFWPDIDISENLLHPDFCIIALYKRVVIGCGLMTPDGYISYLAVRSGWARAGVGRFMLWWLVQAAGGKDVGLHVSANNRAMLLYQRLGFKPEEFIVGFYDKYLPPESTECKNAFYVRLRR